MVKGTKTGSIYYIKFGKAYKVVFTRSPPDKSLTFYVTGEEIRALATSLSQLDQELTEGEKNG